MKVRCQHGFPSFKQAKGRHGADVADVGSILSLKSPLPARCGSGMKNIKKVPVQLTVYTAKIADMGLY